MKLSQKNVTKIQTSLQRGTFLLATKNLTDVIKSYERTINPPSIIVFTC
jgi:hypothetical protein